LRHQQQPSERDIVNEARVKTERAATSPGGPLTPSHVA